MSNKEDELLAEAVYDTATSFAQQIEKTQYTTPGKIEVYAGVEVVNAFTTSSKHGWLNMEYIERVKNTNKPHMTGKTTPVQQTTTTVVVDVDFFLLIEEPELDPRELILIEKNAIQKSGKTYEDIPKPILEYPQAIERLSIVPASDNSYGKTCIVCLSDSDSYIESSTGKIFCSLECKRKHE